MITRPCGLLAFPGMASVNWDGDVEQIGGDQKCKGLGLENWLLNAPDVTN